jgi:hypothetical protein
MGFLCLQPIRCELLSFLRAAVPGTRQIIDAMELAARNP